MAVEKLLHDEFEERGGVHAELLFGEGDVKFGENALEVGDFTTEDLCVDFPARCEERTIENNRE